MPRTYVVTGAASGIGHATVAALTEAGHDVIGVDRDRATISADLACDAGRRALVEQVHELRGSVDAVIACAGTAGQGRSDVQVNHFGSVATLEGLRPLLAEGRDPRAVAVVSYAVLEDVDDGLLGACTRSDEGAAVARADELAPGPDPMRIYATAKRALARWVRRNAPTQEWAGAGIALNSVGPGVVRTPMTAPMLADAGVAELLTSAVPMPYGGVLEPAEVAQLLITMTDPGMRGVTGQTIFIDGGADCIRRGDDIWAQPSRR